MWVAGNVGKGEWKQNEAEDGGDKDKDEMCEVLLARVWF